LQQIIKQDILSNNVVAAYIHHIGDFSLLFVHAGYSQAFLKYLQKKLKLKDKSLNGDNIVNYSNELLKFKISKCKKSLCKFTDELFEAGPDRGGSGIGGPLFLVFIFFSNILY
jgi:hypothetical protein